MSTEKNAYLDAVLKTHQIELDKLKIDSYRSQRDKIKERLEQDLSRWIYNPLNSGSYAKKTAININYDLDLAVPFKKGSFKTLKEMYDYVHGFMDTIKSDRSLKITKVSGQRRSINVLFDVNGHELDMDIVPGWELQDGQYEDDYNLNLFDSKAQTSIQTNIKTHTELMLNRNLERELVKLLKVWKTTKGEDMKSFLVELLVLEAFNRDSTIANHKIYDRLKLALEFIYDNISTIRLVDPANSNNIVSDTLTQLEKEIFKGKIGRILADIDNDFTKLVEYFPINEDHKDQVDPQLLPKYRTSPFRGGYNSYA